MSREISPLRLGAETFFVSGIQPNLFERALSIREWSSSGRVAYFVPACGPHWPERRSRQLKQSISGGETPNRLLPTALTDASFFLLLFICAYPQLSTEIQKFRARIA